MGRHIQDSSKDRTNTMSLRSILLTAAFLAHLFFISLATIAWAGSFYLIHNLAFLGFLGGHIIFPTNQLTALLALVINVLIIVIDAVSIGLFHPTAWVPTVVANQALLGNGPLSVVL